METLASLLPENLLKRFTARARSSLLRLVDRANQTGLSELTPLDLLTLLQTQRGSLASHLIRSHRLQIPPRTFPEASAAPHTLHISEGLAEVLRRAILLAVQFRQSFVGTEHLLGGILEVAAARRYDKSGQDLSGEPRPTGAGDATARSGGARTPSDNERVRGGADDRREDAAKTAGLWRRRGRETTEDAADDPELKAVLPKTTIEKMSRHLHELLAASEKFLEILKFEGVEASSDGIAAGIRSLPALEAFGQNLVAAAQRRELDPVAGREQELERMTAILIRRTKNNPLLVGDPGVGKTALVMGLAQRMAAANVPPELCDRALYMIDMGMLVAGTIYRGEFEARLKELVREAKEARAILFIDEFHTIVGAGSAPGTLDAANLLKPMLASGEIQCIGATTYAEYRRYIERDAALERRLQPIFVAEPSREATLTILASLRPRLEAHHGVSIPAKTLEASVRLASLYLPERFFPDRAIDLLDEAASRIRVRKGNEPSQALHLREMQTASADLEQKKLRALEERRYEEALSFQKLQQELMQKIERLNRSETRRGGKSLAVLTHRNIEELVAETSGVPIASLSSETLKSVPAVKRTLEQRLVGQRAAVETISAALRRARSSLLRRRGRPVASFLFAGPKGVGKTECARLIARALFGEGASGDKQFVKLDMAEYTEAHTISRLIGAPPGYVGYEEGGFLTERIRRTPVALILFDEADRAHPKVIEILLHILEDGVLSDAQGRLVRFDEAIIVLTVTMNTNLAGRGGALGFSRSSGAPAQAQGASQPESLARELGKKFRPELVDRIDRIIPFRALEKKDIAAIVNRRLTDWRADLKTKGISLQIVPELKTWLVTKAFRPDEGAREVGRSLETFLEEPLTDYLSSHFLGKSLRLQAVLLHNRVVFQHL
jgi:ATP-dependent Clp protease ATP-binding subunit ClpC